MEFNDVDNAVNTSDFYNMIGGEDKAFNDIFANGGSFADEAPKENKAEDISDIFEGNAFDTVENDEYKQALAEGSLPLNLEDIPDVESAVDLMHGEVLADYVSIGGNNYDREHVEHAVEAYAGIKSWSEDVNAHFEELDAFEMQLNQLEGIAHAELNSYISQLEDVINNERVNPVQRMEAYKEMQKYQKQQAEFNKGYSESFNALQARKQNAERLKGKAVTNELISIGWKEKDFITASQFMQANNIVIPAISASKELMIALKKAAMFDAKQKGLETDSASSVQRAITGAPARKSNAITPEDVRTKARVRKALEDGKIGTKEMFDFLIN